MNTATIMTMTTNPSSSNPTLPPTNPLCTADHATHPISNESKTATPTIPTKRPSWSKFLYRNWSPGMPSEEWNWHEGPRGTGCATRNCSARSSTRFWMEWRLVTPVDTMEPAVRGEMPLTCWRISGGRSKRRIEQIITMATTSMATERISTVP